MTTDDRPRCDWPGTDPMNLEHHDTEWGVPLRDRRHLFELLTLEGAQAGLSWTTILRKRDGYVEAFAETGRLPSETDESRAMSRDLKKRGFRFVGPTTLYAFMESAGLVNDHLVRCYRYEECAALV